MELDFRQKIVVHMETAHRQLHTLWKTSAPKTTLSGLKTVKIWYP